ncbi:UPF0426 protein At1g28150, chloroplastic [Amborella trichopoda]|uniref:Uncharacterized protein n=1 Tax=Amborella trichopoda TaxID=13333 RepID=W1PQA5_AMBTC|nr:UPF0426 protein At1g28150, chloroplastic [Amborella trichopoda]ERN10228.1 hypothetical protein AMTR_s00171p00054690 [Amborella trichopoda]|eukprot:XP_006848647.1 UPF0426 protein At1g28150, chloroplastic [Amborella trichopoda]
MALLPTNPMAMAKQSPMASFSLKRLRRPESRVLRVKAFLNPLEDPVVKEALKEPVAFFGGMFAGILRLDLNEDPLKEWLTRTVEASGIMKEDTETEKTESEEAVPQQIEIE